MRMSVVTVIGLVLVEEVMEVREIVMMKDAVQGMTKISGKVLPAPILLMTGDEKIDLGMEGDPKMVKFLMEVPRWEVGLPIAKEIQIWLALL